MTPLRKWWRFWTHQLVLVHAFILYTDISCLGGVFAKNTSRGTNNLRIKHNFVIGCFYLILLYLELPPPRPISDMSPSRWSATYQEKRGAIQDLIWIRSYLYNIRIVLLCFIASCSTSSLCVWWLIFIKYIKFVENF